MQNMSSMVRQAQKMQAQIAKLQEEIGQKEVEASTGGGMVIAVVNGKQELISVKINPEVANPEDVEDLEIMIVGAINQAMKTAGEMMDREVGKITGGFSIPGLTS